MNKHPAITFKELVEGGVNGFPFIVETVTLFINKQHDPDEVIPKLSFGLVGWGLPAVDGAIIHDRSFSGWVVKGFSHDRSFYLVFDLMHHVERQEEIIKELIEHDHINGHRYLQTLFVDKQGVLGFVMDRRPGAKALPVEFMTNLELGALHRTLRDRTYGIKIGASIPEEPVSSYSGRTLTIPVPAGATHYRNIPTKQVGLQFFNKVAIEEDPAGNLYVWGRDSVHDEEHWMEVDPTSGVQFTLVPLD